MIGSRNRANGGTRGPDLTDVCRPLTSDPIVARALEGAQPKTPVYANNLCQSDLNALVASLGSGKGWP